jgi:hypothetical protein
MTGGPARIGLIGASWRGDYYLRIAQEVPSSFEIGSVLVQSASSAARVTAAWGVRATTDFDTFLRSGPYDYVVVSVPRDAASHYIVAMAQAGIPVLTETPPARDLDDLRELWGRVGTAPVQVAEQYRFQPQHAARLAVASSGVLGDVHTAQVSVAHDYHGVSLIRSALGVGFDPVAVTGMAFTDRVTSARGRDAWNDELAVVDSVRTIAWLRFDDRLGTYDFNGEQYTSPIRSRHMTLSGSAGEVVDDSVRYVREPGRAVNGTFAREVTGVDGDLEGSYLHRIWLGSDVLFDNPFVGARLNDDEVAVASVMARMSAFVRTGEGFYGLADGCHDHYLGMLIADAVSSGQSVTSTPQPWSKETSVLATRRG